MARQNCSKNLNPAVASLPTLCLTQNTKTSERDYTLSPAAGTVKGDRHDPLLHTTKLERKIICMADMMAH
jgi:hypothetical protein